MAPNVCWVIPEELWPIVLLGGKRNCSNECGEAGGRALCLGEILKIFILFILSLPPVPTFSAALPLLHWINWGLWDTHFMDTQELIEKGNELAPLFKTCSTWPLRDDGTSLADHGLSERRERWAEGAGTLDAGMTSGLSRRLRL